MPSLSIYAICFFIAFNGCKQPQVYKVDHKGVEIIRITADFPEDSALAAQLRPYKEKLDAQMNEVIGVSPKALAKGIPESAMGNLLADVLVKKGSDYMGKKVDFSVITNGGIRSTLPKGNITVGHIFEIMPFENDLVILELDSAVTHELFDALSGMGGVPVGNAYYKIKSKQAEVIKIGGVELHGDSTYLLAISDYLANGGDDLAMLSKAKRNETTGHKIRDAIIDYIRELNADGKEITAEVEGRVAR